MSYLNLIDVLLTDFESESLSYSNTTETKEFWDQFFMVELLVPVVVRELGASP